MRSGFYATNPTAVQADSGPHSKLPRRRLSGAFFGSDSRGSSDRQRRLPIFLSSGDSFTTRSIEDSEDFRAATEGRIF